MRTSLSETVLKRNMAKGDVKETRTACTVVNSLYEECDSIEAEDGSEALQELKNEKGKRCG
jgi:hypothetical protein